MKLENLDWLHLALLLTGSVLTGFSTQAAPSKAESDDHLSQEISEAVFRMDGATAPGEL